MLEALAIIPLMLAVLAGEENEWRHKNNLRRLSLQLSPPPEAKFIPGGQFNPQLPYSIYPTKKAQIPRVVFDATVGLGSTGYNANINYRGFMLWLTPKEFLRLVPYNPDLGEWLEGQIRSGMPIGAPFLEVFIVGTIPTTRELHEHERRGTTPPAPSEPLEIYVYAHEGRTRMAALNRLGFGDTLIPVAVVPKKTENVVKPWDAWSEIRARQLDGDQLVNVIVHPDHRCQKPGWTHPVLGAVPTKTRYITLRKRNFGP
jgi:hypothetical protein